MLRLAMPFLVIALIAAFFGFAGMADYRVRAAAHEQLYAQVGDRGPE